MWLTMTDLRSHIEALSIAEKVELLDALWESIEAGERSLTEEQRAELAYRIDRYARDPSNVIPWEEVREGLSTKQ